MSASGLLPVPTVKGHKFSYFWSLAGLAPAWKNSGLEWIVILPSALVGPHWHQPEQLKPAFSKQEFSYFF